MLKTTTRVKISFAFAAAAVEEDGSEQGCRNEFVDKSFLELCLVRGCLEKFLVGATGKDCCELWMGVFNVVLLGSLAAGSV